jgi:FixJ family two-component response regulator
MIGRKLPMDAALQTPTPALPRLGRVFVVDDDAGFRHSMTWRLEGEGFAVEAFANPGEFLEVQSRIEEGCLLLDLKMPGMGGLELVDKLREMGFSMPIIMISAFGDVPDAVRALKAGVCDFFQKPCCTETLLGSIRAALEGQRRHSERRKADALRERLLARLSERETQVLNLLVAGKRNKEIADDLRLAPKTVEHHRANIMAKLGVDSLAALARLYWTGKPHGTRSGN